MYAVPDRTQLYLKEKMPAVLPRVLPVVVGVIANVFFWGGAMIPFNPAEAEFFIYLNAAIILLGVLLALAGGVMVLVNGLGNVSAATFGGIAANSIVLMATGLLLWGVLFNAA